MLGFFVIHDEYGFDDVKFGLRRKNKKIRIKRKKIGDESKYSISCSPSIEKLEKKKN